MTPRRRPATVAVHAGGHADPATGAVAPPMVPASTFVNDSGSPYTYGRVTNPVWERLEAVVAALEGGAGAVVTASGMAAIGLVVGLVPPGGRVVAAHDGYSGTRTLLRELASAGHLAVDLVDTTETDAVRAAVAGAALLCLETITNPLLRVPDIAACAAAAHAAGALVMVDNTFATPLLVQPLAHGADVVVHSLTKYAGGHSDLIAGALVVSDPALLERLRTARWRVGPIPGQLEAWLALRGIRTLAVRFERQAASALDLARRLETHPEVAAVHYPGLPAHPEHERAAAQLRGGFGAIVSVEVRGGAERAEALCAATELWTHATSLGGVESTLERRARYEVDAEVCAPGLVRLSVGVEDVDDLFADLDAALAATRTAHAPRSDGLLATDRRA